METVPQRDARAADPPGSLTFAILVIFASSSEASERPAHAPAPAPGPAGASHTFSYEEGGSTGPDKWGTLSKDWANCVDGTKQSPIDMGPLKHTHKAAKGIMHNRGHNFMSVGSATHARDRRKIRVLLVEDEEIHRVVARAVLRAAGVDLDEAESGAAAVQRVRERVGGGASYDLILTDKQMPVMDGLEATRRIRAMGVATPIVAVSSDSLPSDVEAFAEAGADDFTPKPLTKEKLGHILSKFGLA